MFNEIMLREIFNDWENEDLIIIDTPNDTHYLQTNAIKKLKVNRHFLTLISEIMSREKKTFIDIEKIVSIKLVKSNANLL